MTKHTIRLSQWLKSGNHAGILCLVVAAFLFVSGGASVINGFKAQRQVAETQNLGAIPAPADVQPHAGTFLNFAAPTTIRIPKIDVSSPLITVGKEANGEIGSPQPGPDFDKAAWYHGSPAPGQYGASVIVGHVDSYENGNSASVFYNLAKLRPGDAIQVERADRSTAVFKIYATRQFERRKMPVEQVYSANTPDAELRLITCAGAFNEETDEYDSNTVIFARLVESKNS